MYKEITEFFARPETHIMMMDSLEMFVQLFLELTLLFIVISYLVSLINEKLPAEKIQNLLGAHQGRGYLTAAGLGAITPFCSCSTIPMLIGLLKARAGFGPTMTFLFTSPLLNPIVIALFIPVLGLKVTMLYAGLALVTSILAGYLLQRFGFERFIKQELIGSPQATCGTGCETNSETNSGKNSDEADSKNTEYKDTSSCCDSNGDTEGKIEDKNSCCDTTNKSESGTSCCDTSESTEPSIWRRAWIESWSLFRSMFPYMLIAMIIGALVHGFIPADFFAQVASSDNPAAVPTAALIGIPLYIRVTALLPLVASFIAKGVSIGAIIALVIGSGGASLPELILLKRLFYWPLLAAFLFVIFSMAVVGGYTFNWFFA